MLRQGLMIAGLLAGLIVVGCVTERVVVETVVVERVVQVDREVEVVVEKEIEVTRVVVVTATPVAVPRATAAPTATPAPDVSDYFVILHQGNNSGDDRGRISFYAAYPFKEHKLEGTSISFHNEGFYLDYLAKEGVITSAQKDAYFNGEPIQKIPLVPISNATCKLIDIDPYNANQLGLGAPEYLTHYADKSSWDCDWGG